MRNLCLNIDYDIFDDLIDVITCKSKDDKSIKTNVKKNNNRKKEEDIIMEDESRNQSKKEQKYQTSIQIDKQLVKQKISEQMICLAGLYQKLNIYQVDLEKNKLNIILIIIIDLIMDLQKIKKT